MRWQIPVFDTRVGRRLVALFLLCAIAPICLMAIFAYHHVASQLEAESRLRLETLAKTTGMGIAQRLMMIRQVLGEHASTLPRSSRDVHPVGPGAQPPPGLVALDLAPLAEALRLHPSGEDHLHSGRPLLAVAPGSDDVRLGVLVPGTETVVWGTADPDFLWGIRDGEPPLPTGTDLCVFAEGPRPLVCTAPDPSALWEALAAESTETVRRVRWEGKGGRQHGSVWSLFLAYEFGVEPWRTVVSEQEAAVTAPVKTFGATFTGIVLLTTFLVLGLSAWMIRRSLAPLRELQEATVRLAGQDLQHRVTIRSTSRDEFHDLAHSFNRMAGQIEQHVGTLRAAHAIDRAILSTLCRADVAEIILEQAIGLFPCDAMGFGLARTDDLTIPWDLTVRMPGVPHSCAATLALHAEVRSRLGQHLEGMPAPADLHEVLRKTNQAGSGIRNSWVFPVMVGRQPRGMILLGFRSSANIEDSTRQQACHLADQAAVAISNIQLVEALGQLHRGALQALARTIDAKSPWTAGHSERVTSVAVALGEWIGLPEEELERLYRGGLLHDIGKIAIPREILDKPGALTAEERVVIETHPGVGARILTPIAPYADVIGIVRSHHERWDGDGYPDGLAGEAIPRLARVLSVADVYDAISSARPYRDRMGHDKVLEIIRHGIGTSFDPSIATAFLAMMARADVGADPTPAWTPRDPILPSARTGKHPLVEIPA